MGGSRNRRRQKKVEESPQTFRDELIAVKETIAGLQIKLENSIKSNENLRCLNTLLVNDLKMEQESKTPLMLALQVRNFSNQYGQFFLTRNYNIHCWQCFQGILLRSSNLNQLT